MEKPKSQKGENLQRLYSVPPKVFKKFWKPEFDRVLLRTWKDKGSWVRCIFVDEFPKLLGEERYQKFIDYANKNLMFNEFSGKQNDIFNYNDIGRYAIRRLQEKYRIDEERDQPKKIKRCSICKKKFDAVKVSPRVTLIKSWELKVCNSCFQKAYYKQKEILEKRKLKISKSKLISYLKKLSKLLDGMIPPNNFAAVTSIVNQKNQIKLINLLKEMPGFWVYKKKFGSYFKALIAADLLDKKARKEGRGVRCLAKDGHECFSLSEKKIDDWLHKNKIKHAKEPRYPLDSNLNPYELLRADWKISKFYIEFFGLKGQKDYDTKIFLKKELVRNLKLDLIEIYNPDLRYLDKKLGKFKNLLGKTKERKQE